MTVEFFKSVFTLPFAPPTLNATRRQHWSAYGRLRDKIMAELQKQGMFRLGSPLSDHKLRVRVTIQVYSLKPRDHDNNTGGCKPIFDCVVRGGWAVDDSPQWMEQVVSEPILVHKRNDVKTVISIRGPIL